MKPDSGAPGFRQIPGRGVFQPRIFAKVKNTVTVHNSVGRAKETGTGTVFYAHKNPSLYGTYNGTATLTLS